MDTTELNVLSDKISIQPKCIIGNEIVYPFVELDGTFLPCCWLSTSYEKMLLVEEFFGEDFKNLNLKNNDINSIMSLWNKIRDSWYSDKPFDICREVCNKKT